VESRSFDIDSFDIGSFDDGSFSYGQAIRTLAATQPNAPALTFGETTMSFADLDRRSSAAASALIAAGVKPGDRVAVLSKNHPVFFELAFGCSKVGAILVGLNWRLAQTEITAIVADAQPSVLIVADEQSSLLTAAASVTPGINLIVSLEADYDTWLSSTPVNDENIEPAVVAPDDAVLLLYTSGTTGVPKGVELTNRNAAYTRLLATEVWGFNADKVNLAGMPMFHIGGIGYGMGAMLVGGHTVLLRDLDASTIITAISTHRVTHAFFVPAVIQTILDSPLVAEADVSSLELLVYGASPISDAILRRAIDVLGCSFMQNYGMTETAGSVVALRPQDHRLDDADGAALLRSCGRAVPWVEVAIIDPTTREPVSLGAVGEIWTRSPMNMRGYRGKPEETAATITADGWLRTGDAAFADAGGYLYLFDRFKDMIVSGAENIYPAEIENVLYDHPAIAEVAVIGVPSERWGETPKAIVVVRPGHTLDADTVIEFARTRLARYKCPSSVDFVDVLPRNASGKVLKKELRIPFWMNQERRIS
jgi:acyl-CoA synthetase (AMP-forming)/AMP-acid ligase II